MQALRYTRYLKRIVKEINIAELIELLGPILAFPPTGTSSLLQSHWHAP
jgi:hypothetical protein